MNQRSRFRRLFFLSAVVGSAALFDAGAVWGQSVAHVPQEAKTAETIIDIQPHKAAIDAFLKDKIAGLSAADPATRGAAREAIIGEAPTNGSTIYYKTFGDALNAQIMPVLSANQPEIKLNAAIVVARIADRANNGSLAGAARALIKDNSDAIILWGLKASQSIIPFLASNQLDPNVDLIKEVTAIGKNRGSAWLIGEVYPALTLAKVNLANNPEAKTIVKVLLPQVKDLVKHRTGLYAKQIPPMPVADSLATSFFVSGDVWPIVTPSERVELVQLSMDLLKVSAAQLSANPTEQQNLSPLVKKLASAFWVIGTHVKNEQIVSASKAVSGAAEKPTEIVAAVTQLAETAKSEPSLAGLKLASTTIPAPQPTPAPSSTASTAAR